MSVEKLISEHMDVWAGAVTQKATRGRGGGDKRELMGINKLRQLILELAVRGKLVSQSSADSPATDPLAEIDRKRGVFESANRGGKKQRAFQADALEGRSNFPSSWSVRPLSDLVRVLNGRAYKKNEMLSSGTPLLRVGNLFTSKEWYYSDLELEADKYIDGGDLIYAWSASFGPFIWQGERAIYHYHIWKLDPFCDESTSKQYLCLFLKAVTEEIKAGGNGIAMVHMTKAKMEVLAVPVPPIEEQHRIVEKVDELMALCDRLEEQSGEQIEAHEQLVDTLLDTLTRSENAPELAENWARVAQHFDTLFTTEHSIDRLKQTVLQLAVMGQLVPQSSSDTSATTLLTAARVEKSKLVDSGFVRARKALPDSKSRSIRFGIPNSWEWVQVDDLAIVQGGIQKQPKRRPGENACSYLRVADVQRGELSDCADLPEFELFPGELEQRTLAAGDVLIVEGNGSADEIGRCAVWDARVSPCVYQNHLIRVRPVGGVESRWIELFLNSPAGVQEMKRLAVTTSGLYNLSVGKIRAIEVPLPPLAEQLRILSVVDEVNEVCRSLRESVNHGVSLQSATASSLVEQLKH